MTRNRPDTLLIPYPYGINTPNSPLKYGIDTVSIHKRLETRDKETSDGIKSTARKQQGLFALEGVKSSRSHSKKRNGQKPKASKVDFSKGVHVSTDGACEPNPGPGGWSFVVYENGYAIHSESGSEAATTNNRMEMQAVIAALRWMQANGYACAAQVHSDSQYCVKGANEWQQLSAILDAVPVSLNWVLGHSGIAGNEAADRLACDALKRRLQERRAA